MFPDPQGAEARSPSGIDRVASLAGWTPVFAGVAMAVDAGTMQPPRMRCFSYLRSISFPATPIFPLAIPAKAGIHP